MVGEILLHRHMDPSQLRTRLATHIVGGKDRVGHKTIPDLCASLGLAYPLSEGNATKADRLSAALAATPDYKLPEVAERLMEQWPLSPADRNALQDIIWPVGRPIAKRCRRDLARALAIDDLFVDSGRFDRLIGSLFILDDFGILSALFGESRQSLRDQIEQHVYRNPGDWDVEHLFDQLGAIDATDTRFARFIEGLVSPDAMPDEPAQRWFIKCVNPSLAQCGLALREISERDGYPVFALVATEYASGSGAKNLIFASAEKPDLRIRDAVNNDIEIVTNAERVLVYDRPIPLGGIRWCDLQSWWKELCGEDNDDAAKKSLYLRLRESLPIDSPPQRLLFETYHNTFKSQIPMLPALLPEVWLHWDPMTVKQRGAQALIRSRMDFLMLLPAGIRVVLEVDGQRHYSLEGRPDPRRYADMVAADRQLKLDGYQVFRFGAAELQGKNGESIVRGFFLTMFDRFGVSVMRNQLID